MSGSRSKQTDWEEAWERGRATLDGVTRARVRGASESVELGVLDWGGDGDLLLMHHANGFCAATLAPIAHALRGRFRVVSIDARGHGDSTPVMPGGEPDPYDWESLAGDARQAIVQILALTGRDRVSLAIGHSFGGALLLRAASDEAARIDRLLLCDPVILPPHPGQGRLSPPISNPLAEATRRRRDRFPTRAEAYAHCRSRGLFANFTPEALSLYVAEGMTETEGGEIALKCHREVEAAIFDGGARQTLTSEVERVKAEVLFVHAERGNFSREHYESVAAQIPQARVEGLDAGHLFPLEEPEHVLRLVNEWGQDA